MTETIVKYQIEFSPRAEEFLRGLFQPQNYKGTMIIEEPGYIPPYPHGNEFSELVPPFTPTSEDK